MAARLNCTIEDLVQKPDTRKKISVQDFISEAIGQYTVEDILKELEKPGRDPRSPIEEFRFAEGLATMEDLKPGMKVPGIVTNITNFGAFVDVGVKQDGLVHISHLSNRYVGDPNEVIKLNQKVMVTVLEVEPSRKRIALSMKDGARSESGDRSGAQVRRPVGAKVREEKLNPFQAKLMELKKNFRD